MRRVASLASRSSASAVQSDELQAIYHPETLRALRQRLLSLGTTGLFSDTGTTIGDLTIPGRAAVVLLGRLPQSYREAIVAVITRMLIDARSATAFAEKRLALDPELTEDQRLALEVVLSNGVPRTIAFSG